VAVHHSRKVGVASSILAVAFFIVHPPLAVKGVVSLTPTIGANGAIGHGLAAAAAAPSDSNLTTAPSCLFVLLVLFFLSLFF
jgi:hypothetical protein